MLFFDSVIVDFMKRAQLYRFQLSKLLHFRFPRNKSQQENKRTMPLPSKKRKMHLSGESPPEESVYPVCAVSPGWNWCRQLEAFFVESPVDFLKSSSSTHLSPLQVYHPGHDRWTPRPVFEYFFRILYSSEKYQNIHGHAISERKNLIIIC